MKESFSDEEMEKMKEFSRQNLSEIQQMFKKISERSGGIFKNKEEVKNSNFSRTNPIQKDDLLNLKIALENINSVDDFIKQM